MKRRIENEDKIKHRMLAKLKLHTVQNPVKSSELEFEFKISDRHVRHIIQLLHKEYHPIGSKPTGYFYAYKYEEIETVREQLRRQAEAMLETVRNMGKAFEGKQAEMNL